MEPKYDYQVEDKKKAVLVVSTLKKRKTTNDK